MVVDRISLVWISKNFCYFYFTGGKEVLGGSGVSSCLI